MFENDKKLEPRDLNEEDNMKVKINEEECTGCEECVEACEAVFAMSDDGELAVVKMEVIPADLEDDVKDAAEECPAEAIIIE